VERDQPLVEVATDKANTEIPSPSAGVLVEQLAQEGATVAVGAALAKLDDGATSTATAKPISTPTSTSTAAATPSPTPTQEPQQPSTIPPPISATGYATGPVPLQLRAYKPPRYTPKEGDQVVPFDHRRRLIAEHMVYSKVTSPHVPCTAEVDMTPFARLREEWKKAKETQGRAPSFLVGLCRAAIRALAEF